MIFLSTVLRILRAKMIELPVGADNIRPFLLYKFKNILNIVLNLSINSDIMFKVMGFYTYNLI